MEESSFPFLRIAKQFDLPYEDVLLLAGYWRSKLFGDGWMADLYAFPDLHRRAIDLWPRTDFTARVAIHNALSHQRNIRIGRIAPW